MKQGALPALGALLLLGGLPPIVGCHSPMVVATLHNGTPAEIHLVEVDYPSASFGTGSISPGANFSYRFKILGSGPLKITYQDAAGKEFSATGPELSEGSEGPLLIEVSPAGVQWTPKLVRK